MRVDEKERSEEKSRTIGPSLPAADTGLTRIARLISRLLIVLPFVPAVPSPSTLLPLTPLVLLPILLHREPSASRPPCSLRIERRQARLDRLALVLEGGPLDGFVCGVEVGEAALGAAPDKEERGGEHGDTLQVR